MLSALPVFLACLGAQPCDPATVVPGQLVRSSSPAAIVSHGSPPGELTSDAARAFHLAIRRVSIPSVTRRTERRAQVALPRGGRTTVSKAMLVVLGVFAGCYAGAYLGEAMEENGGLLGMPIGAAAGGLIAWTLVK